MMTLLHCSTSSSPDCDEGKLLNLNYERGKSLNLNYEGKFVELQCLNYEGKSLYVSQDYKGKSLSVGCEGVSLKLGLLMVTVGQFLMTMVVESVCDWLR